MKNYSAIIIYTDYLLTEEADNWSENMLEIFEDARLYAEKADPYSLEKGVLKAIVRYTRENGMETPEPLSILRRLIRIYNQDAATK